MMQGISFIVELFVLLIWGLDVVLGMQWLRTLGPCVHDHNELTMEFQWKGKRVKLAGNAMQNTKPMTFSQLNSIIQEGGVSGLATLNRIDDEHEKKCEECGTEIDQLEGALPIAAKGLIRQYQKVFEEPKQLPPVRNIDHQIHLQPGTNPINVRPYRYPYFQKDIMEKLVKEMLEYGFIRHSKSPYSSPVLLVKKKDGSWRFCVDYRALNAITIKDRFPIPTVDELLDELGGARFFRSLILGPGIIKYIWIAGTYIKHRSELTTAISNSLSCRLGSRTHRLLSKQL